MNSSIGKQVMQLLTADARRLFSTTLARVDAQLLPRAHHEQELDAQKPCPCPYNAKPPPCSSSPLFHHHRAPPLHWCNSPCLLRPNPLARAHIIASSLHFA